MNDREAKKNCGGFLLILSLKKVIYSVYVLIQFSGLL